MSKIMKKATLLVWAATTLLFSLMDQAAFAHGERATEPYIRTRTVHWYDVTW
uniref:methane monooxygenase/ammonia monooxygenase subunit B n=1 Tax=Proteus mirabilis TaxID=584 RepID=UPI0034D355B6